MAGAAAPVVTPAAATMVPDINVLVCVAITLALASIFIVLRMIARRLTQVALWWDDGFAILGYLFAIGWNAAVLYWAVHAGLGHKLAEISLPSDEALLQGKLSLYIAELCYACSLAFSKMAILGFYWRLFSTSAIRIPIQVLFVCSIIWLTIRTFMAIFHCVPVNRFWDSSVDGVCNVDDSKFFFGTVLVHLLIDLVILALPVVEVKHLQLRLGQKIAVIALFMFGILVCVGSIVVLVESLKFNPQTNEMPFDITSIMIWATVEVNLAIVSACLPMMRPIFRKLMPGSVLGSDPSSNPLSGGHSKNIKMSTITRTKEVDDSSSTAQLADLEDGSSGTVEFEHGGVNALPVHGPRTVISTSRASQAARSPDASRQQQQQNGQRGIYVKNDVSISYEHA